MTEIEAQVRILQHALDLLGPVSLAAALDTSRDKIDGWSAGEEPMPLMLLDRTADLILAKYHGLSWTGAAAATPGRLS